MTAKAPRNALGIDFGTSNSAAGILVNGRPHLVNIEPGHDTVPTAVFFDHGGKKTRFGNAANAALMQGVEGRFMRALKSILGTSLMRERRQIMGQSLTFIDIIGRFLAEVKAQAEASCYQEFPFVLSGRPVHFHSQDPKRDAQALIDLTECYHRAGFREVRFLFEPEAAAIAHGDRPTGGSLEGSLGLIVDIGGGTSDFSLFRTEPGRGASRSSVQILASHGVRLGGTNFDKSISSDLVMPLFGRGAMIRKEIGPGLLTAPNAIFHDLATWEKIPFLYTEETRKGAAQLCRLAEEKPLFERLCTVLEHELGHDVAFAVERGKIAANSKDDQRSRIDLRFVEAGLSCEISARDLTRSLSAYADRIRDSALETLALGQCRPEQVDTVVFVGGSSLMTFVEQTISQTFPMAKRHHSNAFTAVVDGLAIAAATTFEQ